MRTVIIEGGTHGVLQGLMSLVCTFRLILIQFSIKIKVLKADVLVIIDKGKTSYSYAHSFFS